MAGCDPHAPLQGELLVLNGELNDRLGDYPEAIRSNTEAIAAAALNARRIADLRGTVRVLEPPSPYALGTSDAPLLVTIGNGLPFTVPVRLEISSTSGLKVAPIDVQQVPPLGRRQARCAHCLQQCRQGLSRLCPRRARLLRRHVRNAELVIIFK